MSDNESDNELFDEKKLLKDVKNKIEEYLKISYQNALNDLNNNNLKMVINTYNEDLILQQLGGTVQQKSNNKSNNSKSNNSKSTRIKPTRIKPTKTSSSRKILPPISKSKEDSLSKYGYKLSKSPLARRRALKKAARSRGTLAVLKRVNLIGNYSKSVPVNYDKLRADVEFLKDEYAKEKIEKIIAIYAPKRTNPKKSNNSAKQLPKIKKTSKNKN